MLGFGREITTAQRRDGLLRRMQEANADTMESLIAQWRTYLGRQEASSRVGVVNRLILGQLERSNEAV